MSKSKLEDDMALRLLAHKAGGYVREFKFHPDRRWRFDFAWPSLKLALEVEGGTWISGRHNNGAGIEKDMEKYNEAALLGWLVLRVTSSQIRLGTASQWVKRALELKERNGCNLS